MSAPASEIEATFGFVDLAGFTALTEVHGDSEAVALLDRFEAIAHDALGLGDRLVKTIGDAVMVVFPRPDAAVAALSRLFVALAETELPVARAGLHHGPAIERSGDYLGASVNLTARVAAQAHGGQVLATTEVADAPRIRGVAVVDLGCFTLRNITESVQLFELELCPAAAGTAIDPVCRMQVATWRWDALPVSRMPVRKDLVEGHRWRQGAVTLEGATRSVVRSEGLMETYNSRLISPERI